MNDSSLMSFRRSTHLLQGVNNLLLRMHVAGSRHGDDALAVGVATTVKLFREKLIVSQWA